MNRIVESLICPVCGAPVSESEDKKSLICAGGARGNREPKRHCFDFASSGYINLAPPSQSLSGDSKQAVVSRTRFLDGGYYAPIRDAVCEAVKTHSAGGLTVDAGCGEGYYTTAVADVCEAVVGFDLSKSAIDAAAKRVRRRGISNALFSVAGIYSMPLADGCADAVVSLFAPCAEEEFLRILRPGGVLVSVGAGEEHLLGLKRAVYDQVYKNEERADTPRILRQIDKNELRFDIELSDSQTIRDLFSMTPYYYRTSEQDMAKLDALSSLRTEVHVFVDVYRKNN